MPYRPRLAQLLICVALSGGAEAAQIPFAGAGGDFRISVASLQERRFHGVVRQEKDFSCGSAALATLLTYHYGRPISEHEAFDAMFAHGDQEQIRKYGFSMLDMKRYLEANGYGADGFQVPLQRLAEVGIPAIVLLDAGGYKHFVVVKGLRGDEVLVGDPALGLRTLPRAEFEAASSGVLFVINRGVPKREIAFDRAGDWAALPDAPLHAVHSTRLAGFTLELPMGIGL